MSSNSAFLESLLSGQSVTLLLIIALIFILIFYGIQQVPDGNARVVERLGRRHKVLYPGINVIIPGIDRIKKSMNLETFNNNGKARVKLFDAMGNISIAEQRMDPPPLDLLGRDNSQILVNSVAYFKITEPMKTVYDVAALADTFVSMVETTLRQEVGKLDGDTIITSREFLSERLRIALQDASKNWGISIIRVEIEDVSFDREVTESLSKARQQELIRRAQLVSTQADAEQQVLRAEADKKSEILRAEGLKQAEIARAEGERQSQILRAEGKFEEERLKAEGQFLLQSREQEGLAKGYAAVVASLEGNAQAIIALEALKAQAKVAESLGNSNNALIVPSETVGLFGALSATLKALDFAKK